MRSLIFLTVTMGLPQSGVLGREPLPPRALARIGDHRFYHGPHIECAVLSPDGRRVASVANYASYHHVGGEERDTYNRLIVLWDADSGERLRELHVRHGSVSRLAFSADGKRLAAAHVCSSKNAVSVFEVETGELLWQWNDFKRSPDYLQFSTDGKQLRVSEWLGPVRACDAATGKQLQLWKPPSEMTDEDKQKACGVIGENVSRWQSDCLGNASPSGKRPSLGCGWLTGSRCHY